MSPDDEKDGDFLGQYSLTLIHSFNSYGSGTGLKVNVRTSLIKNFTI